MADDGWTVEVFSAVVAAEVTKLPADMREALDRLTRLIEVGGVASLRAPQSKSLGDRLWELRFSGRDGIARALYVTASVRRVVIVHVFIKKTDKTPLSALKLARSRAMRVR